MISFVLSAIFSTAFCTHALSRGSVSSIRHKSIQNKADNKIVESLLTKYHPRLLQFGSNPTLAPIPSTNPFLDATNDIPTPAPVLDIPSYMSPSFWTPFLSPVPTQSWTDERVCEAIIDTITTTDYERSNNPCTCARATEGSLSASGTFGISCNYDYCEECMEGTDLCGTMEASFTYVENVASPAFTFPEETTACVQYTRGRDDKVCVTSAIDYTTMTASCTIRIGDQTCNSCEYATCASSTTATFKSGDLGTDSNDVALSFDCSNIANGYVMNICEYVPYTSTEFPPLESTDPLAFLRFEKDEFQTCTNAAVPIQAPVPVAVPIQAPVQIAPTVVVVPTASPMLSPNMNNALPTPSPVSVPTQPGSLPAPVNPPTQPVSVPAPVTLPTTNAAPSGKPNSTGDSTSSAYFSFLSLSVTTLSALWIVFSIL